MSDRSQHLSPQSRSILDLTAQGHTYEQILATYPTLTYLDIFSAAREALDACAPAPTAHKHRLATTRQSHPRAYQAWTPEEEAQLLDLAREGTPTDEIAAILQRQPSAIVSRLARLDSDTRPGPQNNPPCAYLLPPIYFA